MINNSLIPMLNNIIDVYNSIVAFFYQKIYQDKYTNNYLKNYNINYDLLIAGSLFINNLNENQVNSQIQNYIDLCNEFINYTKQALELQANLIIEDIQSNLMKSIANLNGFSTSLLKAQYGLIFDYIVPYTMSMTCVIFLNKINMDSYMNQVSLNGSVSDFNSIPAKTLLKLSK